MRSNNIIPQSINNSECPQCHYNRIILGNMLQSKGKFNTQRKQEAIDIISKCSACQEFFRGQ